MKLNENGVATLKQLCLEKVSKFILSASQENNLAVPYIRIAPVPPDISQEIFEFCLEEAVTEKADFILDFYLLVITNFLTTISIS